jgi:hypothetical protein
MKHAGKPSASHNNSPRSSPCHPHRPAPRSRPYAYSTPAPQRQSLPKLPPETRVIFSTNVLLGCVNILGYHSTISITLKLANHQALHMSLRTLTTKYQVPTCQNMPKYAGFVAKRGAWASLSVAWECPLTLTLPRPNTPNPTKPDKTRQPLKTRGPNSASHTLPTTNTHLWK